MAIITKPTIAKGQANEFDLSKSDLAAVSKVVNDSYFSDQTNWSKVIVEYKSAEGNQHEMVIFDASEASPKGNFEVSEKAKDSWEVQSVKIMDFDGGYLKLNRGDLTVADFDIALGSVGGDVGAIEGPFKTFTSVTIDQSPQPVSGVMGQTVTVPDMELYVFSFGLSDYLSAGISGTLKVNVWDSVSKTTLIGTSSEMDASVLTSSTYSAVFGFQGISLPSGNYFFELDYSGITTNVHSLAIQRSNVNVYINGTMVYEGTISPSWDAVFVVEGFDS